MLRFVSICVFVTPCACCGCWTIHRLSTVVGARVLWMSCPDPRVRPYAQEGIRSEGQPLLVSCLCRRRGGAFVVVLVEVFQRGECCVYPSTCVSCLHDVSCPCCFSHCLALYSFAFR